MCERVRAQASLLVDGELSELERRMLVSHLERCSACRTYAADVEAFTDLIRSAPLVAPTRPVVVRAGRRVGTARMQVGVAAALALVALGLGAQVSSLESQAPSLARFEGKQNLSPPRSVLEREQAILQVVRPGTTLPPPGSVL